MDARQIVLFIGHDPSVSGAATDARAAQMNLEIIPTGGFSLAEEFLIHRRMDVLVADIRIFGTDASKDFILRFVERRPAAGLVLVSADTVLYAQFYPAHSVCLHKPYDADQLAQAITDARDRVPDKRGHQVD